MASSQESVNGSSLITSRVDLHDEIRNSTNTKRDTFLIQKKSARQSVSLHIAQKIDFLQVVAYDVGISSALS